MRSFRYLAEKTSQSVKPTGKRWRLRARRHLIGVKWATIRKNALVFCEQFGAEAHRLGWTAPELFAVHPEHGTARVDYCGVLMIGAEPARGVEVERIRFERISGYSNGPGQVWGVPV